MSDSVWPHRWQPTRLPHPWDSPSKNTGVGCHFLLQCMQVKSESEVAQSCPTLSDPMDCSPPGSSIQGIFQPRVLEWVPVPSPRNHYAIVNWQQFFFLCGSVEKSCLTLWPHGLQHARLPCPSLSPRVYSNSCPPSWWYYPTISSSVILFSFCLQSFPASRSFPMNLFFLVEYKIMVKSCN